MQDPTITFPAYFIKNVKTKRDKRDFIAEVGMSWLQIQHMRGARGGIMVDIDDTLINTQENVLQGFESMLKMYQKAFRKFPIHIVTARPDDTHEIVLDLLNRRGYSVGVGSLHMLPSHCLLYTSPSPRD